MENKLMILQLQLNRLSQWDLTLEKDKDSED